MGSILDDVCIFDSSLLKYLSWMKCLMINYHNQSFPFRCQQNYNIVLHFSTLKSAGRVNLTSLSLLYYKKCQFMSILKFLTFPCYKKTNDVSI